MPAFRGSLASDRLPTHRKHTRKRSFFVELLDSLIYLANPSPIMCLSAPRFHLPFKYQATSRPSYGINSTAESGSYSEGYYDEEEDYDLEDELAKLDDLYTCE